MPDGLVINQNGVKWQVIDIDVWKEILAEYSLTINDEFSVEFMKALWSIGVLVPLTPVNQETLEPLSETEVKELETQAQKQKAEKFVKTKQEMLDYVKGVMKGEITSAKEQGEANGTEPVTEADEEAMRLFREGEKPPSSFGQYTLADWQKVYADVDSPEFDRAMEWLSSSTGIAYIGKLQADPTTNKDLLTLLGYEPEEVKGKFETKEISTQPTFYEKWLQPLLKGLPKEAREIFSDMIYKDLFGVRDANGNIIIMGKLQDYIAENPDFASVFEEANVTYSAESIKQAEQIFQDFLSNIYMPPQGGQQAAFITALTQNETVQKTLEEVSKTASYMPRKVQMSDPFTGELYETELPALESQVQNPYSLYLAIYQDMIDSGVEVPDLDEIAWMAYDTTQTYEQNQLAQFPKEALPPMFNMTGAQMELYGDPRRPYQQTRKQDAQTQYGEYMSDIFSPENAGMMSDWFEPLFSQYESTGATVPFKNYMQNLGKPFFESFLSDKQKAQKRMQVRYY